MTRPTAVDTTLGRVEIEFGINRWVLVTIGSETGQIQLATPRELTSYLLRRGLTDREAEDLARTAWSARPREAEARSERSDESLRSATGLSSSAVLLLVVAVVVIFALVVLDCGSGRSRSSVYGTYCSSIATTAPSSIVSQYCDSAPR